MLALGPIVMMVGFMMWPVPDDVVGQAAVDILKDADMNMILVSGFLTGTGVLMMFGSLFLLSQDLMANSGKMQRDMLLMSRMGVMFAFTVFYLFFATSMESAWLVQEGREGFTPEEDNDVALTVTNIGNHIWGSMPLAWGTALILLGAASVTGNNTPKETIEWVYALPAVAGLCLMSTYLTDLDVFFFVAVFCGLPIGIMLLTGHLKIPGSESE